MPKTRSTLAAALAAVLLAACGSTPTKESTGEYIDDSVITAKVKAALVEDKDVKAIGVTVSTFKGNVRLAGVATKPIEVDRAMQLASRVAGVKSVTNDIQLKQTTQ
jgi:osmotically-inducible protein OsmY